MAIAQEGLAEQTAPRTLPWKDAVWAAALLVLALGQFSIGTDPAYTGLVVTFIVLTLIGVKLCGGMKTLSGITVFYTGFQHIICSQYMKLFMGQRADLPLLDPIKTMMVYCLAMLGIVCAAALANWAPLRAFKPVLTAELTTDKLKMMAYICTFLMIVRYLGSPQVGIGGIRFLMNFEFITPMSAAVTAAWVVQESKGKKFLNWLSWINIAVPFLVAMIGFQRREAIFVVAIMIAVAWNYGFRFGWKHIMSGLVMVYFFQFIFFPFALYYRNSVKRTSNIAANLSQAWEALTEVIADPIKYQDEKNFTPPANEWEVKRLLYYNQKPIPTLDRMSIIIVTDALIRAADQNPPTGWWSISEGFNMLLPRVFNEDKAILGTSNPIAQLAPGAVNDLDLGTQITLGFFCEAYLSFRWWGVFFLPLITMLLSFLTIRFLIGDCITNNLWAGAWIVILPWVSSEGVVQQFIILYWQSLALFTAFGFFFLIIANSLGRGENRQRETVEDPPVFEGEKLRLAG